MHTIAIDQFGQRPTLHELPVPRPGRGEVLLRVHAEGVNPVDWQVAEGWMRGNTEYHFPMVLGFDVAGVIEECGPGVEDFTAGDEVFGSSGKLSEGTYAEYAVLDARTIARMPETLSFEQAAAIPIAAHTAMQALDELQAQPGDVVLIIGASGGVGSFAVQMAAQRGCTVIATARREDASFVLSLGATATIDYTNEDVVDAVRERFPIGIDVVLDVVSDREQLERIAGLLSAGGRIASTIGAVDDEALRRLAVQGRNVDARITRAGLERLAELFDSGRLHTPVTNTFPLVDAPDAIEQSETGHVRGKLVLTIP
jgi:NADPH:quinone reductase-like Zn-dependent oxidoreductase